MRNRTGIRRFANLWSNWGYNFMKFLLLLFML